MNDYFSVKRVSKLIWNDIKINSTALLISLVLLIILFTNISYGVVLYVGGLILASTAFNHIHDRQRANLFLMLPCSNLERFLSRWFVSAIGYPIIIFLFYKKYTEFYDPYFWMTFGNYLVFQSIVFLGAITFKKHVFIKTTLTVVGIMAVFMALYLLMGLLTSLIFYPNFLIPAIELYFPYNNSYPWLLIAPFCWYIAYLRLTEYELN